MNREEFEGYFQEDHGLKFDDIKNKLSDNRQLHVFLLLHKLVPSRELSISAADHDIIYLNYEPEDLIDVITKEQIFELSACRVDYDSRNDYLTLYV